jgi:methylmalonic aciduria homocystinuria type C protein
MSVDRPAWEQLLARLRQRCTPAGFDLAEACRVGWYNQAVLGELKLDDFGSAEHLAIVVGNSRALWPPFVSALGEDPSLLASAEPLERYTELTIGAAVRELGVRAEVRWAHELGARLVAIQRLAHVAGLAYLSPSHLSVHPIYGPWVALRAAITFELAGPERPRPQLAPPCGDCSAACLPSFERARSLTSPNGDGDWRHWLACRDACPAGREHRYYASQIVYHYSKDREVLVALARGDENRLPTPDAGH